MKELASFGFANTGKTPGEGDLALFCPACPQPGINLPPDWSSDPEQWVYTRVNVMDGNFVCIHRMLKNQEGDMVWLKGKGEGYMTSKEPYDNYIDSTIEEKEVWGSTRLLYHQVCVHWFKLTNCLSGVKVL